MIGNLLNALVGLWLVYSAIFAEPASSPKGAIVIVASTAALRCAEKPKAKPRGI